MRDITVVPVKINMGLLKHMMSCNEKNNSW